ncbi:MAG: histidine-type phosphatase [Negativicutes bacterium]|jgi:acid phosphatase
MTNLRRKPFIHALLVFVLSFNILITTAFASEQLVMVVAVTRHGDRTPFDQIVNSPIDWKNESAELTPTGMNQLFSVGSQYHQNYMENQRLLPEKFNNKYIAVYSSDTNRTMMSAESLLYGLYPLGYGSLLPDGQAALPKRFQPVPIRMIAADSSLIITPYTDYLRIMKENVYSQPEWQKTEQQNQANFARWTKILGNNITGLNDVMTVGDVLLVRSKNNIPLPAGLTDSDQAQILKLTSWALAYEYKTKKVSSICGAELLQRIGNDINTKIANQNDRRFVYYSGHDLTILPLMTLMNHPLSQAPGYASHIEFEVYQDDAKNYIVRLVYNNAEVARYPLADFNKLVASAK